MRVEAARCPLSRPSIVPLRLRVRLLRIYSDSGEVEGGEMPAMPCCTRFFLKLGEHMRGFWRQRRCHAERSQSLPQASASFACV